MFLLTPNVSFNFNLLFIYIFSTTLGSISNSPSACFVASDGKCLRVYQAIIDARTLLAEINSATLQTNMMQSSVMSMSSGHSTNPVANAEHLSKLKDKFKIVSTQSTARPGAIIELEAIADATQVREVPFTQSSV